MFTVFSFQCFSVSCTVGIRKQDIQNPYFQLILVQFRPDFKWKKIQNNIQNVQHMNVTSFSSISYYSNARLISKIELEQNFQSIIIFQIEIHEPYPDLNSGQHIRRAKGLVRSNRYINGFRPKCQNFEWLFKYQTIGHPNDLRQFK